MDNYTGIIFPSRKRRIKGLDNPTDDYTDGEVKSLAYMMGYAIGKLKIVKEELHDLLWRELTRDEVLTETDTRHLFEQYVEAGTDTIVRFLIEDREPYVGYIRTLHQLQSIAENRSR